MRPLREVYSDITNLKCRKEIQKAYDVVRDRYHVFAKKAQEIVEDTLAAVREANTEFMRVWGKALLEYPEESVRICQLGWNVGEELKRNDIRYLNKEKMWNGPDTE